MTTKFAIEVMRKIAVEIVLELIKKALESGNVLMSLPLNDTLKRRISH